MNCYREPEENELSATLRCLSGVMNRNATPNPSIEGMPKRLRLLRTPHVKR
jgi:hypothetical protein